MEALGPILFVDTHSRVIGWSLLKGSIWETSCPNVYLKNFIFIKIKFSITIIIMAGSYYVALASLDSQTPTHLCLPASRVKGVCSHAQHSYSLGCESALNRGVTL